MIRRLKRTPCTDQPKAMVSFPSATTAVARGASGRAGAVEVGAAGATGEGEAAGEEAAGTKAGGAVEAGAEAFDMTRGAGAAERKERGGTTGSTGMSRTSRGKQRHRLYLDAVVVGEVIKLPDGRLGQWVTQEVLGREVDEGLAELPVHLMHATAQVQNRIVRTTADAVDGSIGGVWGPDRTELGSGSTAMQCCTAMRQSLGGHSHLTAEQVEVVGGGGDVGDLPVGLLGLLAQVGAAHEVLHVHLGEVEWVLVAHLMQQTANIRC